MRESAAPLPLDCPGTCGAPSKKNDTGTCRICEICCSRLAPMRFVPFSFFCSCWNVMPSASPSFVWLIPSIMRRMRTWLPTCLSIGTQCHYHYRQDDLDNPQLASAGVYTILMLRRVVGVSLTLLIVAAPIFSYADRATIWGYKVKMPGNVFNFSPAVDQTVSIDGDPMTAVTLSRL
jgi:hypothetical protein